MSTGRRLFRAGLAIVVAAVLGLTGLVIASAVILPSSAGSPASGALFISGYGVSLNTPVCSASVVPSRRGNVLITAAHCLGDLPPGVTVTFAPNYHDQQSPDGTYTVTRWILPPGFPHYGGTVNRDYAFLIVNGDVQRAVGAEKLGTSQPFPRTATLEGYAPDGGPIVCTHRLQPWMVQGQEQIRFNCGGFEGGASGGPYLTRINHKTGLGTIVGVLGGYQSGGDSPSVSYSSPFGPGVMKLYEEVKQQ